MILRNVRVVPHDSSWREMFLEEAERIAAVLGPQLVYLHHVGSTAVPELPAKPIIDMLSVVREIETVDRLADGLAQRGYVGLGEYGLSGRRYFWKGQPEHRYHLHCYQWGNPAVERHLAFRDFLRASSPAAKEYGDLKQRLAQRHPQDIEAYMAGKDALVKAQEARALRWWSEVPVIIITGPTGVGKSTTAEALAGLFEEAHIAHWVMDVDRLTDVAPHAPGDRFRKGIVYAGLGQLWPVMRSAGTRLVILPRVVESAEEAWHLGRSIPGGSPWVVRLTALPATLERRISQRESGESRDWHQARARELAAVFERVSVADLVADTENQTPRQVAERIWTRFRDRYPAFFVP